MIREAKLDDAVVIAKIIVETWQNAYDGIIDQYYVDNLDVQRFLQIITNNIKLKKEIIFVYEENEIIKGFISGKFMDDDKHQCETVGFYVLPKYQQKGIGRILFKQMKKMFFERNCRKMILWTLKGAKNNSFYRNNGGVIADEKILKIGEKEYSGVGFSFNLHPITN
ncbi:GNAT family N-acetyltransferase [Marispirochaeta sp.]|uniref:GNAT family N-acetyltransferase n=1 Tax=Marispirochaeta sp. TaxID=2038653 RepID=UPI0029C63113|nr:GNAT family N-acetyltransferase [Marispirochaeta sp.]